MRIALGSDHGGFKLKEAIKEHLTKKSIEIKDFGTFTTESVDYPDLGMAVAESVAKGDYDKAILCCGTGIGISISANKVPGIRCALCGDTFSAKMSIEHNNANILALGERVIGLGLALEIVDTWLEAQFQGGRHGNRIGKISEIEKKYSR